jgi:glycosyltransferase involved in cell wall biosynthesis
MITSVTRPTISIIIPAYNVEKYISDTLDCIRRQTKKPDEIIIVDDGSEDSTADIIQNYQTLMSLRLIRKENEGQGIARNQGINEATSDYIYFLDADDLLKENFCEDIIECITQNNFPEILLFSGDKFYDTKDYKMSFDPDYKRGFEGIFDNPRELFEAAARHNRLSTSPCLYISKRSLWTDNELQFKANFHEDDEIFLPLLLNARKFVVTNKVYFMRRIRHGSTMTMGKSKKHADGYRDTVLRLCNVLNNDDYADCFSYVNSYLSVYLIAYIRVSKCSAVPLDKALLVCGLRKVRSYKLLIRTVYQLLGRKAQMNIRKLVRK